MSSPSATLAVEKKSYRGAWGNEGWACAVFKTIAPIILALALMSATLAVLTHSELEAIYIAEDGHPKGTTGTRWADHALWIALVTGGLVVALLAWYIVSWKKINCNNAFVLLMIVIAPIALVITAAVGVTAYVAYTSAIQEAMTAAGKGDFDVPDYLANINITLIVMVAVGSLVALGALLFGILWVRSDPPTYTDNVVGVCANAKTDEAKCNSIYTKTGKKACRMDEGKCTDLEGIKQEKLLRELKAINDPRRERARIMAEEELRREKLHREGAAAHKAFVHVTTESEKAARSALEARRAVGIAEADLATISATPITGTRTAGATAATAAQSSKASSRPSSSSWERRDKGRSRDGFGGFGRGGGGDGFGGGWSTSTTPSSPTGFGAWGPK